MEENGNVLRYFLYLQLLIWYSDGIKRDKKGLLLPLRI